ncbi:MAG TPA: hypothetical protein VIH59_32380, partial [Candidatus Tectomicrobia bacterium]
AIFSDQIHLWDLPVSAWRSPAHQPGLSGLETLRRLQQQEVITAALLQKVQEEGEAVLQQFVQEGAAHD